MGARGPDPRVLRISGLFDVVSTVPAKPLVVCTLLDWNKPAQRPLRSGDDVVGFSQSAAARRQRP